MDEIFFFVKVLIMEKDLLNFIDVKVVENVRSYDNHIYMSNLLFAIAWQIFCKVYFLHWNICRAFFPRGALNLVIFT